MAGFTNAYGAGSGNASGYQASSQAPSDAVRNQINKQKQRQYAPRNGMAEAQATQQAVAQPAPSSPVAPTGQIAPPAPLPAPGASAPAQPRFEGANPAPAALDWAINNPALSAQVTNQMKGGLKDQAAMMAQQAGTGVAQNAASRGLSGGGWQGQQEQQIQQGMASDLLSGYRDIDVGAADTNRKNLFAALGIDSQNFGTRANILGTMMNRENAKDQTGLGYSQLNQQSQQALWDSIFR